MKVSFFSKCHTNISKRITFTLLYLQHAIPCVRDIISSQSKGDIWQTSLTLTRLNSKETAEDILWKQYFLWKLFPWTDGAGASQALPDKKKVSDLITLKWFSGNVQHASILFLRKAPITFCFHKVKMPTFFHYCFDFFRVV